MIKIAPIAILSLVLAWVLTTGLTGVGWSAGAGQKIYVGTDACRQCHEGQYARFSEFSKKSHSYQGVRKLAKGLTENEIKGCWQCHTTGYGKPGGFRSEAETPHLQHTGCEVCHGPGSVHAVSQSAADIVAVPTMKDCEGCHNADRIEAFHFKPLLYGGAH